MLGRASTVRTMERDILHAVSAQGFDLQELRDQPLLYAYISARPGEVVLDRHQLIFGDFQTVRLQADGEVVGHAENRSEQCHSYKDGRDLGAFICMSETSPFAPCCLKTIVDTASLESCILGLRQTDGSVAKPLFVHGQGPFKEILKSYGGELFKICHRTGLKEAAHSASSTTSMLLIGESMMAFDHEPKHFSSDLNNHVVKTDSSKSWLSYALMAMLAFATIVFAFSTQDFYVACRILLYLLSLSTMKITVKLVFLTFKFRYAMFLCSAHFSVCSLIGLGLMLCRQWRGGKPLYVPTAHQFKYLVIPIAIGAATSIVASNIALAFCSVALSEIVSSTSPIISVAVILLMGKPFDKRLLMPAFVVVAGVTVSVHGKLLGFSILGVALTFLGNVARAGKSVLQEQAMISEARDTFDPLTMLTWTFVPSALAMWIWSLTVEGISPFSHLMHGPERLGIILALLLSCVNATFLNFAGIWVVKDIGAVSMQLISLLSKGISLLGAVLLFHDEMTLAQTVGFVVALGGVWAFSHMQACFKKEQLSSPPSLEAKCSPTPKAPHPSLEEQSSPGPNASPGSLEAQSSPDPSAPPETFPPALIRCAVYFAFKQLAYGFTMGLSNATVSSMVRAFSISPLYEGIVVGNPAIIMALLSPAAGWLADRLGRRRSEMIAALTITAGSIVWASSGTFSAIMFGRSLHGMGLCLGMVASSLHAAEIAPSQFRGALGTSLELFLNIGIVIPWCLANASQDWRFCIWVSAAMTFAIVPANWLLAVESPRWLLMHASPAEAREAAAQLLSSTEQVQFEASIKQGPVEAKAMGNVRKRIRGILYGAWDGSLWRPLLVSQAVAFLHHACGIGIIMSYSNQLLMQDFGPVTAHRCIVCVGLGKILAIVAAVMVVDSVGRRQLLITSLSLMSVSYIIWSLQAMLVVKSITLVLMGLLLNVGAFGIGIGPLNYVIPAEVWPQEHRDQGVAVAQMTCRLTEGVVAVAVMPLLAYFGGCLPVLLVGFATICAGGALFFVFCFEETKQQSLEDVGGLRA